MRGAVSVALVYLHFDSGDKVRSSAMQQSSLLELAPIAA